MPDHTPKRNISKMLMATFAYCLWSQAPAAYSQTCDLPQSIIIASAPGQSTLQYVNWQLVRSGTPANFYAQNCTNGSAPENTQWISFKLITQNYFSPGGVGDHIPFQPRSSYVFDLNGFVQAYSFRGPIFHVNNGLLGEYSNLIKQPATAYCQTQTHSISCKDYKAPRLHGLPLFDNVEYRVLIHATAQGTNYRVTDQFNNFVESYYQESPMPENLANSTGFGVAVLCHGPDGGACNNRDFSVAIYDIAGGWFNPRK